jgi:D-xylose transport system substrate-binding protein
MRNGRWKYMFRLSVLLFACLIFASCMGSTGTTGGATYSTNGGKGCTKVGILLPETLSSIRWETEDRPQLLQAIKAVIPGVHIDFSNAQGNSATQISQAESDLANGDCILIVGPHDSVAAAPIVAKAKALNVPVIAYDRLIQSKDLSYYVSFDNLAVGVLQGKYITTHYEAYQKNGATNVVMISGSQTDTNALLYSIGSHSVLDPLFAHNTIKNVSETFTPNWDNNTAQSEMEASLTDQQDDVQVAYVANDGMANGVINALKAVHLNGKVLVTGQDATAVGINHILAGDQSMTVYKPIIKEAQSTAEVVKAIYQGTNIVALSHGQTTATYDGGNIPSIFAAPISVDKNNIATTVIADKYLTKNQVCDGIPVGTDGVC